MHHHRVTRFQVGCHGTKARRQSVKIRDRGGRQRQTPQYLAQLLALDKTLGKLEVPAAQAEWKIDQEILLLFLPPEGEIGARGAIAKSLLPVHRSHDRLDFTRRITARIQAADDRAHAGAGDRIDGNMQCVKHLEHANVCGATGAAAR